MKKIAVLIASLALFWLGCESEPGQAPLSSTQSSDVVTQSAEAELSSLLAQIQKLDEQGADVPEEVYARYYELEEQLHPEFYSQHEENPGALDELSNTCPGTYLNIAEGSEYFWYSTCGQTYNATNNCTYPDCRYGRDVMIELDVEVEGLLFLTTTGSRFDTYLCMYYDNCCGQEGSSLFGQNNNNPNLCNGQFLAAGMVDCVYPGTYWIVLDGAGPAARGSYCLHIEFYEDECEL